MLLGTFLILHITQIGYKQPRESGQAYDSRWNEALDSGSGERKCSEWD